MRFLKHMFEQPFITATGAAALLHSTWSLGTLFAGEQPEGMSLHFIGWLIPALLIAFALDVGQIATSAEIREYGLTLSRMITFVVFALATYYLQWLYIAHHMPMLELAPGISETAHETATMLRDAALWIIPALLPLSTLLYTFSSQEVQESTQASPDEPIDLRVYRSELSAKRGLAAYQSRHCPTCALHGTPTSLRRSSASIVTLSAYRKSIVLAVTVATMGSCSVCPTRGNYWAKGGVTFEDPDGWGVVFMNMPKCQRILDEEAASKSGG